MRPRNAKYRGKTITEWAADQGVSYAEIHRRIKAYGDPLGRRKKGQRPKKHMGRTKKEWAEKLGVSVNTIQGRIRRGKDPRAGWPTFDGKTVREIADELGITRQGVWYRIKTHGSPYKRGNSHAK